MFGGLAAFNYVLKPAIIQKVLTSRPIPAVPVTVAGAKTEKWRGELPAIGTVEAVRGVMIAPLIAGRVEAIMFESGQQVKAGQTILKLDDSTERAQLQAALAKMPAQKEIEVRLGELFIEDERFAEAAALFTRLTEADPGHAAAWVGLSDAERSRRRIKPALEAYRRAVSAGADRLTLRNLRYRLFGEYEG